jgi:hypothetical protein
MSSYDDYCCTDDGQSSKSQDPVGIGLYVYGRQRSNIHTSS